MSSIMEMNGGEGVSTSLQVHLDGACEEEQ